MLSAGLLTLSRSSSTILDWEYDELCCKLSFLCSKKMLLCSTYLKHNTHTAQPERVAPALYCHSHIVIVIFIFMHIVIVTLPQWFLTFDFDATAQKSFHSDFQLLPSFLCFPFSSAHFPKKNTSMVCSLLKLASQTHPYFERKSSLKLAKFGCNFPLISKN